jgi:hypothetical protein
MIVVEIRMKSMRISTTHDDTSLKKRRGVSVPYFFLNSYTGVMIYIDYSTYKNPTPTLKMKKYQRFFNLNFGFGSMLSGVMMLIVQQLFFCLV